MLAHMHAVGSVAFVVESPLGYADKKSSPFVAVKGHAAASTANLCSGRSSCAQLQVSNEPL